ncbi:MAG: hypothetical protein RLZ55_106 [Actinomycetota bacterium]
MTAHSHRPSSGITATPWTRPYLIRISGSMEAAEGVLPGITEHGHIRGNSLMHMNGNTTPINFVGTAPFSA